MFVTCSADRTIKVTHLFNKSEVEIVELFHSGKSNIALQKYITTIDIITCLAVTSDDKYLISGSADKTISIYDLEERAPLSKIKGYHQGKFQ